MTAATPEDNPRRFRLKSEPSVIYEFGGAGDVTLRDVLLIEKETTDAGHPMHMGEIVRLGEKFQKLTKDEARHDADAGWMLAVTIWLSRVKRLRDAGDTTTRVSFLESCDFKIDDFEPITNPGDHRPKARKSKAKAAPRKGSPRAAASATAAPL